MKLKSSLENISCSHTHIYKSTHSSYHCWKSQIGGKLLNRCWHSYVNMNRGELASTGAHTLLCSSPVRYSHPETMKGRKGGEVWGLWPMPTLPPSKGRGGGHTRRVRRQWRRWKVSSPRVCLCICGSNYCSHQCVCVCASYFPVLTSLSKRSH